jgi:NADH-quinone oxidoreductase subunit M
MILLWLIVILLAGGLLAWLVVRWSTLATRWISLGAITLDFVLGLSIWARYYSRVDLLQRNPWFVELDWNWISQFGIHFHLAMDGLSLLLLLLTFLLGIVSVLVSWNEIREGVGFFHFNVLWVLAGVASVFLAVDLFLFYFAWELMLVPMYFLIAIWGHEKRVYAATKFFLFTQLSSLLMLIAILTLYFLHHQATGVYTFQYAKLLGTPMAARTAMLLMLGFFVAFAVKLPVIPLHTWLADAHTEAPTAGSVILAGLLLKTGGYGLMRFAVPLFPSASRAFGPIAMGLAVAGIIYGAVMALSQSDMKRLVAYTSVSHLGFVLLGIYAFTPLALSGAKLQMVSHGISTGALFILVGLLQDRIHTRDLDRMGGLWKQVPRMGAAALALAMALVGLPGLVNFVSEYLVLAGVWQVSIVSAVLAGVGLVIAMVYALRMFQAAFQGAPREKWTLRDLSGVETGVLFVMIALLVVLGLFPQPVIQMMDKVAAGALAVAHGGGGV